MQLSVIILNYNVRYFLETCVLSVQKAIETIDAEIIVIDNNSSDESCQMMRSRFPNIKLIENQVNLGFPKGNNIGVNHANGAYVCILNPDTVVAEDTFVKILHELQNKAQNTEIGILGCKLIDGTGRFLPESKRGIPTPWIALTKIFGLYKIFPKSNYFNQYYAQHLSENESGQVAILVGAFMIIKRKLYNELGGFDENCFMYSDDIDLSYMAIKAKKNNIYFHETTVIHYKGESTIKDGAYMKRFSKAMNFFYKKHFKASFFFTVFMKIGSKLFAFSKLFTGKNSRPSAPDYYLFLSDNTELKSKIENKIQQDISLFNQETEKSNFAKLISKKSKIEYILDLNYISFKEAILFFEQKKNENVTFKLLPPDSNFIIGSNSSNDRGEVIIF